MKHFANENRISFRVESHESKGFLIEEDFMLEREKYCWWWWRFSLEDFGIELRNTLNWKHNSILVDETADIRIALWNLGETLPESFFFEHKIFGVKSNTFLFSPLTAADLFIRNDHSSNQTQFDCRQIKIMNRIRIQFLNFQFKFWNWNWQRVVHEMRPSHCTRRTILITLETSFFSSSSSSYFFWLSWTITNIHPILNRLVSFFSLSSNSSLWSLICCCCWRQRCIRTGIEWYKVASKVVRGDGKCVF